LCPNRLPRGRGRTSETGSADENFFLETIADIFSGPFDRIASVGECIAHVASIYETYFRPDGADLSTMTAVMVVMHSIGRSLPRGPDATNPWITKIFDPGGL